MTICPKTVTFVQLERYIITTFFKKIMILTKSHLFDINAMFEAAQHLLCRKGAELPLGCVTSMSFYVIRYNYIKQELEV